MVVDVLRVGGYMKRRTFISGTTSGLLAAPLAAHAQEQKAGKVYRIGFPRAGQPPKPWVEAFQQGLRERGYVDGQNVVVEFRFTDGGVNQLPRLAEELVRLKVDVILASAAPPALAAKKATTSVPIVFVNVFDPVEPVDLRDGPAQTALGQRGAMLRPAHRAPTAARSAPACVSLHTT